MFLNLNHKFLLSAVVVFLLGACSSPPASTAKQTALPVASPTTEPPTATPTIAASPTPALEPEEPATSIDQVAGKWKMKLVGGSGSGDPAVFTLSVDGTYSMDGIGGEHDCMNVGAGAYRFEGDVLVFDSRDCLKKGPSEFFACVGKYNVFSSAADGKPARLRFVAIDDPSYLRITRLDGKSFTPYMDP